MISGTKDGVHRSSTCLEGDGRPAPGDSTIGGQQGWQSHFPPSGIQRGVERRRSSWEDAMELWQSPVIKAAPHMRSGGGRRTFPVSRGMEAQALTRNPNPQS